MGQFYFGDPAAKRVRITSALTGMEDQPDNDLLADMIADVAFDVLSRIGDDSEARYQFFKRFVELAKDVTGQDRPKAVQQGYARNLSHARVSQVGIGTVTG